MDRRTQVVTKSVERQFPSSGAAPNGGCPLDDVDLEAFTSKRNRSGEAIWAGSDNDGVYPLGHLDPLTDGYAPGAPPGGGPVRRTRRAVVSKSPKYCGSKTMDEPMFGNLVCSSGIPAEFVVLTRNFFRGRSQPLDMVR